MSKLFDNNFLVVIRRAVASTICATLVLTACTVYGQGGGNTGGIRLNNVGGIKIDAKGVVTRTTTDLTQQLKELRTRTLSKAEGELGRAVDLRMISLRSLEEAITEAQARGEELSQEILFLAGLQRVQYVFAYPEHNDVVIAGPAEGWKVNGEGAVVGNTTERPVIHLEDLMVALRTANNAANGYGISCSIDPTPEGRQRLANYLRKQKRFTPAVAQGVQNAMGPQKVTLTGVPTDSRFARILVAADFQMKRYAMDLENAPVSGMPSFLDLMKTSRVKSNNMSPRWWMACNYDALGKSDDGLAWELRGQGVKAMTEDEVIANNGDAKASGRVNPLAQKWADTMTAKYEELSAAAPVFGDLRNIMDLCVVSALIEKEGMLDRVNLQLPQLMGKKSQLDITGWTVPVAIPTHCSYARINGKTVITASGGVQVDSWEVTDNAKISDKVVTARNEARANQDKKFWWN